MQGNDPLRIPLRKVGARVRRGRNPQWPSTAIDQVKVRLKNNGFPAIYHGGVGAQNVFRAGHKRTSTRVRIGKVMSP